REELMLTNEKLGLAQAKLEGFNRDLMATVDSRTKELEQANRELKALNHEMDDFIYKSSHDMKGPLVRLLGICHVALMDVEEKKAREYFDLLKTTSLQLNDIFDRLKTVVRINNIEMRKEKIYFDLIVEKIRNRLKSVPGYFEISFDVKIEDNFDFYSDEFLIETIFFNMMENAVKFQKNPGENNFIKIRVKKKSKILISFADNGIGIKESEREHLFEMFSKAALEHHNVGLGLYIVKQSLKKLGGTIKLERREDSITKFVLKLPAELSLN
ncbi:MAG: HAMP domain-containing histidine kinase, partial [Bacteroidetes bacterium]|nr:HAMP domain-containing histidine kinase [Bacteroidota bacterium]